MKPRTVAVLLISILFVITSGSYEVFTHENHQNQSIADIGIVNLTGSTGNAFSSGSIQAFGQNGTSVLLSGTSFYYKPSDYSLPALVDLRSLSSSSNGTNLSNIADMYFHDGSVFGTGWNGTSWILTGEISWGSIDEGSAVALNGTLASNLTPVIGKYFQNGGIWFDAWNGTGWLFGGNNDREASLVALYHGRVIDYSGLLNNVSSDSWIQLIAWNGTSWLIGGHGIFGFIKNGKYTSVLDATEFRSSGVYSAVFRNNEWIIGGGPPAGLEIVKGLHVVKNLTMPSYFNKWVNGLAIYGNGILAGGESSHGTHGMDPALYYVSLSGDYQFTNLTARLPGPFDRGQIQYLAPVSLGNVTGILIVGQGNYNETDGSSNGAVALLSG